MTIMIGCDYHPRWQMIAILEKATGELTARRLEHENAEAKRFYGSLPMGTRVGIEATGATPWFERLRGECGHELWVGDPAEIRARRVRKQKTDERDARHLLDLLLTNRFPRVWGYPRRRIGTRGSYCNTGRSWWGCGLR